MGRQLLKFVAREERFVQRKTQTYVRKRLEQAMQAKEIHDRAMGMHVDEHLIYGKDDEVAKEH